MAKAKTARKNKPKSVVRRRAKSAAVVPVRAGAKTLAPVPAFGAWEPLVSLRREVDRLFDEFNRGSWGFPFGRTMFDIEPLWTRESAVAPAVEVTETDGGYEVTAELPGLAEKNIEVKLSDGMLTIKGEKQEDKEEKKKDYYFSERRYGSFQRSFQLPEGIDTDKAKASFDKGVLTVTLPRGAEAKKKAKTIAVAAK